MNNQRDFRIDNRWITSLRSRKNSVDPFTPYLYFNEKERTASGKIDDVSALFLTNAECPFKCLMCDLWKNTTDTPVPEGAIAKQIETALSKLPKTNHLKLYNSGSFFDNRAIPSSDYKEIAELISDFKTVTVESHTAFIDEKVVRFREMINPELHVAIGLETVHPEVLPLLNKQMNLIDFEVSTRFLVSNSINTRAFILLRPPFLSEKEGIFWAKKSIDFAFEKGVTACTVIPVRAGNGAMDFLSESGNFKQPKIESLEEVVEYGIKLNRGDVFADLWDIDKFSNCNKCFNRRKERLNKMNLYQKISPGIRCSCTR